MSPSHHTGSSRSSSSMVMCGLNKVCNDLVFSIHDLFPAPCSKSSCEDGKLLGAGAQPMKVSEFTTYQKAQVRLTYQLAPEGILVLGLWSFSLVINKPHMQEQKQRNRKSMAITLGFHQALRKMKSQRSQHRPNVCLQPLCQLPGLGKCTEAWQWTQTPNSIKENESSNAEFPHQAFETVKQDTCNSFQEVKTVLFWSWLPYAYRVFSLWPPSCAW